MRITWRGVLAVLGILVVLGAGWAIGVVVQNAVDAKMATALRRADRALAQAVSAKQLTQAQQRSRQGSAEDTCRVLQKVIERAYKPGPSRYVLHATTRRGHHLTLTIRVPHMRDQAQHEISADGLANCAQHAQSETRVR